MGYFPNMTAWECWATDNCAKCAHAAFDPLWRRKMAKEGISKTKARGRGYKWLAAQIGMDPKHCHIGEMTAADARRVVEACRNWKSTPTPETRNA